MITSSMLFATLLFISSVVLCFRCRHCSEIKRSSVAWVFGGSLTVAGVVGYAMLHWAILWFPFLFLLASVAITFCIYRIKDQRRWVVLAGSLIGMLVGFYTGFPWEDARRAFFVAGIKS